MDRASIPPVKAFLQPILQALLANGGTASAERLQAFCVRSLQIPSELERLPHDVRRGARTEVSYRMAWARTQLKQRALVEPLGKKLWSLTELGRKSLA